MENLGKLLGKLQIGSREMFRKFLKFAGDA